MTNPATSLKLFVVQDILLKHKPRYYYRSSSFKMAALFTMLLGIAAVMLGYVLYDFSRQNFIRETEAAIDNEMEHIISLREGKEQAALVQLIKERIKDASVTIYVYRDVDGKALAGNVDVLPENIGRITEGILRFPVDIEGQSHDMAAKIHTFENGSNLLIARDIHDIVSAYEYFTWFAGVIILFMLIVVLMSFFLSVFVVQRTNRISQTARQIMATGDLSKRITLDSDWDDLSHMSQTLNTMFNQIEELVHGIRDLSDNIAHDLRTPLARIRQQLEKAVGSESGRVDAKPLLEEVDQLLGTFNALLRISNLEKGKRHQDLIPLPLKDILEDVVELYMPLAEEKSIAITQFYDEKAIVNCDRDLLFQMCANIMDNAVKFSPEESVIGVDVVVEKEKVMLTIADQGEGVSETEKEQVFRRFYRGDDYHNVSGNGLGLSLVKAIANVHRAMIALEDNHPGLRVVVVFDSPS